MVAFEAPAGSIVAMEGRMWHTSGANVTASEQRAMLFAYYSSDFIRPQTNWQASLSPDTIGTLDDAARQLFGLGAGANIRMGGALTRLGGGQA
jgi:ectoine hydroxylase-related dioxygenase (phytanoyl-CoA dioxygenase family)